MRKLSFLYSGFVAACLSVLANLCFGQETVRSITDVLKRANVSGSLAYWSPAPCRPEPFQYPSFPEIVQTSYSASPLDTLREMFVRDQKMRVTEGPGGIIRMAETEVPTDMLDIKIHQISFDGEAIGTDLFHGPIMAMRFILMAPEVQAFAAVHNIRPVFLNRIPGNVLEERRIHGQLNEVTVSQALDYLLHTFPGYWLYGNCRNEEGEREVFFWFIDNVP